MQETEFPLVNELYFVNTQKKNPYKLGKLLKSAFSTPKKEMGGKNKQTQYCALFTLPGGRETKEENIGRKKK